MKTILMSAVAIASALLVGLAVHFSGVFERDISVTFASATGNISVDSAAARSQSHNDSLARILLLPADKNECQRRRVLDEKGGAVDDIDLTNGSTRVVEYKKLPNIYRETTYYPAADFKDCESFAKSAAVVLSAENPGATLAAIPVTRGQLLSEIERDATGLKPVRERRYAADGKLTSQGNLTEGGAKFQTDHFGATGLVARSETYNLVTKAVESETLYRDGVRYLRQAPNPLPNNFVKEYFSADGKVVTWKETRSYGYYGITRMYADGTPKTEATRGVNYTTLREYRPDGTSDRLIEDWQYTTDVTLYNAAGKPKLETKWKTDSKGPFDADGKPRRYLAFITETNDEGKALRRFDFRKDGTLETVTVFKEAQMYKDRVEYNLDPTGKRVVSMKPFDGKGDVMPLVVYTSDPGIGFDVDKALLAVPDRKLPEGLFDYDSTVTNEVGRGRGPM